MASLKNRKKHESQTRPGAFKRLESESNSDQVDDLNLEAIQAHSEYFNNESFRER